MVWKEIGKWGREELASAIKTTLASMPGTTPCSQAKCQTCLFICTTSNPHGPTSQMIIHKQFNCQTYSIMYVIHCNKCAKLFVGKAWRTLKTRFKGSLADLKHRKDKPFANHFNQTGHSIHNVPVKKLWPLTLPTAPHPLFFSLLSLFVIALLTTYGPTRTKYLCQACCEIL